MTSHQDRHSSSRDYEREAERTRRQLAEHLDELSDRLTPGQVFDEMLTYSRAGGGTFLRAFNNAMRENPLPSLLIGAGCMMFLSEKLGLMRTTGLGNGGRPMRSADEAYDPYEAKPRMSDLASSRMSGAAGRMSEAASRVADSATSGARSAGASVQSGVRRATEAAGRQASNLAETAGQAATSISDTVAGATDAVRSTSYDLRDQAKGAVSGALDQVKRSAGTVAGTVADTVLGTSSSLGGLGDRVADSAARTRRGASEALRQGREQATSFITEQPLLCAAIGVAVGAAIASLIPSSEAEDEWMGETSDAVKDAAGQAGADALDSAKNVAGKVAERAQSAAKEEGFSPSAVAEAAPSVGEGIQEGAKGHQSYGGEAGPAPQSSASEAVARATRIMNEDIERAASQSGPTSGAGPQEQIGGAQRR